MDRKTRIDIWRTVLSLAHVDGRVHVKEAQWLLKRIKTQGFTDEELEFVDKEMANPQNYLELFESLPVVAQTEVLRLCGDIFLADGVFSEAENIALQKMKKAHKKARAMANS